MTINRKDLIQNLVISNMELVASFNGLEEYDSFTNDLLNAFFAKCSDQELLEEAKNLGIEEA